MLGNVQRNVYRPGTGTQTDCDDDYREQNEKNRQGKDAFSRSMPSSLPAYLLKPSFERNTITASRSSVSAAVSSCCSSPIIAASIRLIGGLAKVTTHRA